MGHPKRKLKNFIIAPNFQIRFSLYFMFMGLTIIGMFLVQVLQSIEDAKLAISSISAINHSQQYVINTHLTEIVKKSFVVFFTYAVFSVMFSIVVSHRIAGPTLVINRMIRDLIEGKYNFNRNLRKSDELHSIMENLKELEATLRNKAQ